MRAVPGPGRHAAPLPRRGGGPAAVAVDERAAVDVALQAGEMSLHDADVLHGSGANRSDGKRVGFVIRYVTPEARPRTGRPTVVLARGRGGAGPFHVVGPPTETDGRQALAELKKSAALHLDAMLQNLRLADR
jgi:hypothetical protein